MCKVPDEMDRAYQEWVFYNHSWDNSKYLYISFIPPYYLPVYIIYPSLVNTCVYYCCQSTFLSFRFPPDFHIQRYIHLTFHLFSHLCHLIFNLFFFIPFDVSPVPSNQ